jgi:hypothetical protein
MAWEPTSSLAKAVVKAGFRYDPAQDIIYSKFDAWQRQVGFTWPYDVASAPLHMIIDCETFYFWHDRKPWLIELWKGQYGLETGAEVGVYVDDVAASLASIHPKSRFYNECVPLGMRFTLYRKGAPLLHRAEPHWWLTGFKWGVFTEKTKDLVMDLEIECLNPAMRDAFNQAVIARGYPNSARGSRSVAFRFHTPKTPQPGSRQTLEGQMQAQNQRLVDGYNSLKLAKNISTNDPNAFTGLDEQAQAVQVMSGAATQIQNTASAAAKKVQGKTSPLVKKIQSDAPPAARRIHSTAAAAVNTLQGVPDDARTAYNEIFAFFDKKVWHVTR